MIKSSGDVAAVKNGWLIKRNSDIYPGDTIIVLYNIDATGLMTYWLNLSQILFQFSTTTVAINSVGVL